MITALTIDRERIARFCRERHVRKLSLFGSVLRTDFRPDSDVDVLVEFEPEHGPGFIRLHAIEEELSQLIGKPESGSGDAQGPQPPDQISRLGRSRGTL